MTTAFAVFPSVEQTPVIVPQSQSVLIIDDDESLSEVLSHRLERQGFRTVAAFSGRAGLAHAKAAPPAAIILDLGLPDDDGLNVCQQLSDSPETCGVPILILSGREERDLVRRCRSAGCHYFLRKPCDPSVLLVLVRQAIEDVAVAREW